ncbi:hypothetical protein, partial [Undibacterium umbellatum]|uniref:hypothetical protein n=1 Tax=Undibacterium umbellatum TaxID=2762300 RepID=UPI001C9B102C
LVPAQVSLLLPAIPVYISFSVSLFLLIVYFNKQECPKKSGYLNISNLCFNAEEVLDSMQEILILLSLVCVI